MTEPRRLDTSSLRLVDLTGRERHLRYAMQAMGRVAASFCRGARRTLPFLVRRKARLTAAGVTIGEPTGQVAPGPVLEVYLEAKESPAWGTITIGPVALAVLLEGTLGGGAAEGPPRELGPELTLAQKALVARVARSLAQDFAVSVQEEAGLELEVVSSRSIAAGDPLEPLGVDGLHVDCLIEGIEGEPTISVAVSAEALQSAVKESAVEEEPSNGDPRMMDAVLDVPVEVVAILGREMMGLRSVLGLKVGQVIRLDRALDDPVTVHIAGIAKLTGEPVLSRGQLSIEIKGRLPERGSR